MRERLLKAVGEIRGQETVEQFRNSFKPLCQQAVDREIVVQVMARLPLINRWALLLLHPRYLGPYFLRIRLQARV